MKRCFMKAMQQQSQAVSSTLKTQVMSHKEQESGVRVLRSTKRQH